MQFRPHPLSSSATSSSGSSTGTPLQARLIFRKVYVDVPPSPYTTNLGGKPTTPRVMSTPTNMQLKENAPFRLHEEHTPVASPSVAAAAARKRKLSQVDNQQPLQFEMPAKKHCGEEDNQKAKTIQASENHATTKYDHENAKNQMYCHQCNRKAEASNFICCTFLGTGTTAAGKPKKARRCGVKLCKQCLRNRYGENLDQLKARSGPQTGHIDTESYVYKCPRCRDMCNCRNCRKAKGLEPTGNFTLIPKEKKERLIFDGVVIPSPRKMEQIPGKTVLKPKPPVASTSASATKLAPVPNAAPAPKPRAPRKPKAKPLPKVLWTPVGVDISTKDMEDRVYIREFVLRFSGVMEPPVAKTHQEELGHIAGSKRGDEGQLVEWVSDGCVKAVIQGLLGLIAKDSTKDDQQALKNAMKEIRGGSFNMTKLWNSIRGLREGEDPALTFPDPFPPPEGVAVRSTRAMYKLTTSENIVQIVHSAQMIPVIIAIMEEALQTDTIRNDIMNCVQEGKDTFAEGRNVVKKENERWDAEKAGLGPSAPTEQPKSELSKEEQAKADEVKAEQNKALKEARDSHKHTVQGLETCIDVAMSAFSPRFVPLGADDDGRVYWALTPGVHDRDYALEVIATKVKDKKTPKRPKKHIREESARKSLKDWSWFIAIYGKKPRDAIVPSPASEGDGDEADTSSRDVEEEQWWAVWQPEEIKKLAQWLTLTSNLDVHATTGDAVRTEDDADSAESIAEKQRKVRMRHLVKALNDYASAFEWRMGLFD